MEHYSKLKRNELVILKTTWIDLKSILLSKRSQPKRLYDSMMFWQKGNYRDRKQISNGQDLGLGASWGDEMLHLVAVVVFSKTCWTIYSKG